MSSLENHTSFLGPILGNQCFGSVNGIQSSSTVMMCSVVMAWYMIWSIFGLGAVLLISLLGTRAVNAVSASQNLLPMAFSIAYCSLEIGGIAQGFSLKPQYDSLWSMKQENCMEKGCQSPVTLDHLRTFCSMGSRISSISCLDSARMVTILPPCAQMRHVA